MKRILSLILCTVFILIAVNAFAQEKATIGKLGRANVAVKIGYIDFTDNFFVEDQDDNGIYVAIEGYWAITDTFYLGGEVGRAANISLWGNDIDYLPVELNAKYVIELSPHFFLDIGGGVSYNRADISTDYLFGQHGDLGEDWLFGGQGFTDLTYKIKWFTISLNGKYQITQDYKDTNFDFSNYRLGLSIGFAF